MVVASAPKRSLALRCSHCLPSSPRPNEKHQRLYSRSKIISLFY
ncbi:ORF11 [Barthadenovirus mellis]|uniref:ORF11 n=1 Tax=Passerine adenovirus 1 TaxID=2779174 RepID=A0A7L9DJE0_9ADEN|nr:ORF11 [Passerine adenovirus 1]